MGGDHRGLSGRGDYSPHARFALGAPEQGRVKGPQPDRDSHSREQRHESSRSAGGSAAGRGTGKKRVAPWNAANSGPAVASLR